MSNFLFLLIWLSAALYASGGDTKTTVPPATLATVPPPMKPKVPPPGTTTVPPPGKTTVPPAILTTIPPPTKTMVPPPGKTTVPPAILTTVPPSSKTKVPPPTTAALNGTIPTRKGKSKEIGCDVFFTCQKVLEDVEPPKPCIKYCVNRIICDNGATHKGRPNECVEVNEKKAAQVYREKRNSNGTVSLKHAGLRGIPCRPGFVRNGRGKCRRIAIYKPY